MICITLSHYRTPKPTKITALISSLINLNKPQDQEWHDQLGTEKKNYGAIFQDHHLHTAFGLKSCCSLNERH